MAEKPLPESEVEGSTADKDSERLAKIHDEAMQRFDSVAMPQQELRADSLQARRFVTIPGAQWEGQWGVQYENVPRPEVDKITKSLEKIETDYRENRLTVDYVPSDEAADDSTAETLDGIHRADSYHFKAQQARDNAFQEAIRGGFGAYRLTTDYADPYDPSSDEQRVNPGLTIVDADQSVYFDGASKVYDKSDAEWAFVVSALPRATAIATWGEDNIDPWPLENWKWAYDWYTPDVVRIAEYYVCEKVPDKLFILTHETSGEEQRLFESELAEGALDDLKAEGWTVEERDFKRKRVRKYVLNGSRVLKDCKYIAGCEIPIVPVYGRRDFVDNMERWRGHVGKRMDRQRIYNASIAKVVELQALAPYEVPIVDPEQVSGYVDGNTTILEHWAKGNIERYPVRLLHALRNENGEIVSAGPIGKIEPPQVQPATAALLQVSSADLTDDDDQADEVKANVSADAMDIAASRVDSRSAIYLDNMRQSIQREAEIYLGMAKEVYFEPGRKVETRTQDGKDGQAVLHEPYMGEDNVYRIRNDLSRGRYKVIADVQESTVTARQKTVRQNVALAEIAVKAGSNELANAALLTAVMNQDGEGQADMQDWARQQLIGLGVVKPTPEEQRMIEQAAQEQQNQPPSAADQALQAQAMELVSKAKLNDANAVQKIADAMLKEAQAQAVGGPVSEPETPSGLTAANDEANIAERFASADLKRAQAEEIRRGGSEKRIRMGHEIEMERRQQEQAEREPRDAA
ncbi:portal protein [Sphingomonas sp.]|uniref:portal protein n=1 Tax=Sphingomonas sp. TaxID=28214 RepID=UPI0031E08B8B